MGTLAELANNGATFDPTPTPDYDAATLAQVFSNHFVEVAMNELMMLGLTGLGSGIDLSALIAFLGFAIVYFLAPVVGYQPYRPAGLSVALYALIVYVGVALLQLVVQYVLLLISRPGGRPGAFGGGMPGGNEFSGYLLLAFAVVKIVLFLIAMISFVAGLRNLRLQHHGSDD